MKFAYKLALLVVMLLSVALGVVGSLTLLANFNASLTSLATQNAEQHLVERFSLENDLASKRGGITAITTEMLSEHGEQITGYVGSSNRWLALYSPDGTLAYSNLPQRLAQLITDDIFEQAGNGYVLRKTEDAQVMLIASVIEAGNGNVYMVSVYNITKVFQERNRQMRQMLVINAGVLVVAAMLAVLLSRGLTRPLRKLNLASRKIAGGDYATRSNVQTRDEIGELSANFNKMAQAVQVHMDNLNLSVKQREDFVSAFTHEVKTPMTAILGYSDLLRSQQTEEETRQRAAQFIYREARRLEGLSQKLLMLMGLSSQAVQLLPVSLSAVFLDAARSMQPALAGCELALHRCDGIYVLADHDLIVDLLRNLMLNAVKAAPSDNLVRLDWLHTDNGVCISVSDSGCGIPPEELRRIVEPFYMVDKSRARKQGGSGVGLALAQKIATLHNTELTFKSAVGQGTTVSFVLQLA